MFIGIENVSNSSSYIACTCRGEAEAAVRYLNGTVLDERTVRVDHDWGFVEGRQWGRGRSGGQVRQGEARSMYMDGMQYVEREIG